MVDRSWIFRGNKNKPGLDLFLIIWNVKLNPRTMMELLLIVICLLMHVQCVNFINWCLFVCFSFTWGVNLLVIDVYLSEVVWSQNLDRMSPTGVYKINHSVVDTHTSLFSYSHKWFSPVKKASSVIAASTGSTALAIRAYHSPNTQTQLKPVHLSTGVV